MDSLRNLWNTILDILLGSASDKKAAELLLAADRKHFASGETTAILPYRNPEVRKALWLFKYRGNRAVAQACAEILWEVILPELEEERIMRGTREILLIPIPSSGKKKRIRGFNQTEILAKIIAGKDSSKTLAYSEDILRKIRETKAQADLKDRRKRLENIRDSMEADPEKIAGKTVFLIDDITTTGGTLKEAVRALRAAGAKRVLCFAVAH